MPTTILFLGGPLDGTESVIEHDRLKFHSAVLSDRLELEAGGAAIVDGADHRYVRTGVDAAGRLVFEYRGGEG